MPIIRSGSVGPGAALQKLLDGNAEIVATVIWDTYFAENTEEAINKILKLVGL